MAGVNHATQVPCSTLCWLKFCCPPGSGEKVCPTSALCVNLSKQLNCSGTQSADAQNKGVGQDAPQGS